MKTLLTGMPYTPSKDMGPDYLKRKFSAIRKTMKEQADSQAEAAAKVTPLTRKERKT